MDKDDTGTAGEPLSDASTSDARVVAHRASRAFLWSVGNIAVGRLGTLAINIALARMLGPAEFGAFAVALVTLIAVLSFNELGVSLAIVRWTDEPAEIAPTVATVSTVMSAALAVGLAVAAPWVASLMDAPDATRVVQVMAVAILVNGIVAAPAAVLQREMLQRRRMAIDQVNTWLGAIVSLVLAGAGFGAMSLAVGRISGAVVAGVMFILMSPLRLRFGWDTAVARRLLHFGLPLAAASTVTFAAGYADQLVVSSLLGPHALGLYVLALNVAGWPTSVLSQPLRSVAPAALARLQHDPPAMSHAFVRLLRLVLVVTIPVCVALSATAEPVVRVVYGSEWAASAGVLSWLALAAVTKIFFEICYDFMVVTKGSLAVLTTQLLWVLLLVPSVVVGATSGVTGVGAAQFAVSMVVMVPVYAAALHRRGVDVRDLLRAGAVPIGVGAGQWLICRVVDSSVMSAWWSLAACSAPSLLVLGLLMRPHLHQIRELLSART